MNAIQAPAAPPAPRPHRAPLFLPCAGSGLKLGLGGAPLGNLFAAVSPSDAQSLLQTAWDSGCRSFDTAPHYGHGLSEHRIGGLLREHRGESFVIASKVGRVLRPNVDALREQHGYVDILPFDQHWDYSAAGVRRSVEDSLQRLGLARIDVAHVHDMDAATHGDDAPRVLRQVLEETLPALAELKAQGLVGAIGLGSNDTEVVLQVLRHADLDALLLAGRYSLIDHTALAQLLPACQARGVQVALGGVFNSGILATGVASGTGFFNYAPAAQPWVERVAAIEQLCHTHHVALRAAALQFAMAHPAVQIVMLGARRSQEWSDAQSMARSVIDPAFWTALRRQGLLPEDAPTP